MPDVSDQFALSVQSLSKLKYTAKQSPNKGLKPAAQQFEALFLQRMLKAMRDTIPKNGLLDSNQMDSYKAMLDHQRAQKLADQGGVGLADMLVKQLEGKVAARNSATPADASDKTRAKTNPKADADTIAGFTVAEPQQLAPAKISAAGPKQAKREVSEPVAAQTAGPLVNFTQAGNAPLVSQHIQSAAEWADVLGALPAQISSFVGKLAPAAREASRNSGVSERLILAQAALETGWGRHELSGNNGQPTHNVFNIKATGWQGDAVDADTTEFANGQAQRTRASFRAYDSYKDAFADYVRLLTQTPRYQSVVNAGTPQAAAHELQASGYASDPQYANKLLAVMEQIPSSLGDVAKPLIAGLDSAVKTVSQPASRAQVAKAYTVEVPLRNIF